MSGQTKGTRNSGSRNKWGTLHGGEQNETMQSHVQGDTMKDVEHQRWLAHKEAALHATFPTELCLNGIEIPIFKLPELESIGAKRLKLRALNTRDLIKSTRSNFFGHHPELVLNPNAPEEALMKWFIDVQVTIAAALGADDLDHAAFGAPHFEGTTSSSMPVSVPATPITQVPAMQTGQRRQAPCWSQEGVQEAQARAGGGSSGGGPPPSFPWSQHGVNDDLQQQAVLRTPGEWRSQGPSHQGFSLVPPNMSVETDAMSAAIRQRSQASSISLG